MILLGAVLVAAAVVLYVVQPVFSGEKAPLVSLDEEFTEAEARRHLSLVALRDVEYDFATGKIDERDYRRLRDELAREALDALHEVRRSREQTESASDGAGRARGRPRTGNRGVSGRPEGGDAVRPLRQPQPGGGALLRGLRHKTGVGARGGGRAGRAGLMS